MTDVNLMGRDLFIGPAGSNNNDKPSGDPVEGCWFCLSSQTANTRLIVSIGKLASHSSLKIILACIQVSDALQSCTDFCPRGYILLS